MTAYVYYSYEEWGRGYFGARFRDPEGDDKYLGSFSDPTFAPTDKIVLATFATPEEALAAEVALHQFFDVALNPHFANRARQTSTGFSRAGSKDSKETKERKRVAHLGKIHPPEVIERQVESRRNGAGWGPVNERTRAALLRAAERPKSESHKSKIKVSNSKTKREPWKKEWWDAVVVALKEADGRFLWGKQKIMDEFEVSERTLRKMKKLIEQNVSWEEAKQGRG